MIPNLILIFLTLLGTKGHDKPLTLSIIARNGNNGKAIAQEHLLVFTGTSKDEVLAKRVHADLVTDGNGTAELRVENADIRFLQVWVDHHVLCQTSPNSASYNIDVILTQGLQAPNDCGGMLAVETTPGHFDVFARPYRFFEGFKQ